jgi:hypothetical protein
MKNSKRQILTYDSSPLIISKMEKFLHDLASPLTVVRLNLDLIEMTLPRKNLKTRNYITVAKRNMDSLAKLLREKQR